MTERCPDGERHVIMVCGEYDESLKGSPMACIRECCKEPSEWVTQKYFVPMEVTPAHIIRREGFHQ